MPFQEFTIEISTLIFEDTVTTRFFADPEAILGTTARLFAAEGAAREVAVLTYSTPELVDTGSGWNYEYTCYTLFLHVPVPLYTQLESEVTELGRKICEKVQILLEKFPSDRLTDVKISPTVVDDPQWREKASAWLAGEKISNQGRVRSDNVAPLSSDGLLFRSKPEIYLYKALKEAGVSFAPLAVFVRGGPSYVRIEPDFFIVADGLALVVEVDGDTVHQETPAEAHARTTMLQHEGVNIERVKAADCATPEKAKNCCARLISTIKKLKSARK